MPLVTVERGESVRQLKMSSDLFTILGSGPGLIKLGGRHALDITTLGWIGLHEGLKGQVAAQSHFPKLVFLPRVHCKGPDEGETSMLMAV